MTRSQRLELFAVLLLATGTIATAWAAYQARQWTGEQAQSYSMGTAARIAQNRSAALATSQTQVDVATFIQWVDARAQRDGRLARFYRARFRDEFKPAFAAWVADPGAAETPFALPQYRTAASAEAARLEATAAAASERAKDANERAGSYMLAVVLFATALFFAGISTRLETRAIRLATLGIGCAVLVGTLIWTATFPVQLSPL